MFAEHRAYKMLRRLSKTHAVTRYASAMYRARLYSRYAKDPKLSMQMQQQYIQLKKTPIGQRIVALGQKERRV